MKAKATKWLILCTLAVLTANSGNAQPPDRISSIDGAPIIGTLAYFNAAHCADPTNVVYDLDIVAGGFVRQAYVWVGTEPANCDLGERRTNTPDGCVELPGNPLAIDERAGVIESLSLQDLVDTGVVDCDDSAVDGDAYQFYSFRSDPPGTGDVDVNRYKLADFIVDVVPPERPEITSPLEQTGLFFVIEWEEPSDVQSVASFNLYASDSEDPSAAVANGVVRTASSTSLSVSIRAEPLDLVRGDEVFFYVAAVDQASTASNVNGNASPLSVATRAIVDCDPADVVCPVGDVGSSGGCGVSTTPPVDPSTGLFALVMLVGAVRRSGGSRPRLAR